MSLEQQACSEEISKVVVSVAVDEVVVRSAAEEEARRPASRC